MLLQFGRKFLGIGVTQVANLRVAAVFEWCIEMCDQCAQAQALTLVATDQHAVGSCVGDQARRNRRAIDRGCLRQRRHDAHDFGGRGVLSGTTSMSSSLA